MHAVCSWKNVFNRWYLSICLVINESRRVWITPFPLTKSATQSSKCLSTDSYSASQWQDDWNICHYLSSMLSHQINETIFYWCHVYIWESMHMKVACSWLLQILLENIQLCLGLVKLFIILNIGRKERDLHIWSVWYNLTKTYDVYISKFSKWEKFFPASNVDEIFCLFLIVFPSVSTA